jgi:hypothetical protein
MWIEKCSSGKGSSDSGVLRICLDIHFKQFGTTLALRLLDCDARVQ